MPTRGLPVVQLQKIRAKQLLLAKSSVLIMTTCYCLAQIPASLTWKLPQRCHWKSLQRKVWSRAVSAEVPAREHGTQEPTAPVQRHDIKAIKEHRLWGQSTFPEQGQCDLPLLLHMFRACGAGPQCRPLQTEVQLILESRPRAPFWSWPSHGSSVPLWGSLHAHEQANSHIPTMPLDQDYRHIPCWPGLPAWLSIMHDPNTEQKL